MKHRLHCGAVGAGGVHAVTTGGLSAEALCDGVARHFQTFGTNIVAIARSLRRR